MEPAEFLIVCVSACIAVFVLLTLLALAMRALVVVFPERTTGGDAALLSAVATAASAAYPGMKITRIEEEK
jgi:hypothetical protein